MVHLMLVVFWGKEDSIKLSQNSFIFELFLQKVNPSGF